MLTIFMQILLFSIRMNEKLMNIYISPDKILKNQKIIEMLHFRQQTLLGAPTFLLVLDLQKNMIWHDSVN